MEILENALKRGQRALTEYDSKQLLSAYGIRVTRENLVNSADDAAKAAEEIGFPVAIKGSGAELMHKSEAGAVVLNIPDANSAAAAFEKMKTNLGKSFEGAIVSEMVTGSRELVFGLHRQPQFGPCVMLGIGGVLTEILNDTAFRVAPFDRIEALDMASELRAAELFKSFRGEAEADMDAIAQSLCALGNIGMDHASVSEIDINPVIIRPDGRVVAVDALVVLEGEA